MSTSIERFRAKIAAQKEKLTDTQRILHLDRKPEPEADYTDALKTPEGTWALNSAQNQLLHEAASNGGGIGAIGVGFGKTLASLMLPQMMNSKKALILIPAPMRRQIGEMAFQYSEQFKFDPELIHIESYCQLSQPGPDLLETLKPDLIIADECHKLANKTSARTKRFIRYMKANPETRFVGMTGTLFSKSIRDAMHLIELALRNKSPMPLEYKNQLSWAACIDVHDDQRFPGWSDWKRVRPLVLEFNPERIMEYDDPCTMMKIRREIAREAFFARFASAPGIVHTIESSCNAPIYMNELKNLKIPEQIESALVELRDNWELPNGDPIDGPLELSRATDQLLSGFYYHWVWPDGIIDHDWLESRRVYNREVREWCKKSKPGQDSPKLVLDAVEAGDITHPPLQAAHRDWMRVADRPKPPTETKWLNDYLVSDALERVTENTIIWYKHGAVAKRLRELGVEVFGAGDNPEALEKPRTIACSQRAHGTGKELQKWHKQIVLSPSSNGKVWEQLLGRMHRQGQKSDEVWIDVYQHCALFRANSASARADSLFQGTLTGQKQKLRNFVTIV